MKEKIRQALSARKKLHIGDKSLNEAAVVLPIFYRNGEYHILFTRRSNQVPHHKGQVSFPGGGRHESDRDLRDTALRETWEEVGLRPEDVEILGELDDTCTATSGFVISPFVAFIPYPYEFKVSHDEIDEIFDMPISTLLYKADVKKEHYAVGDKFLTTYSYEYGGRVIWGATAGILRQFLEIWQSASGAHT